MKLKHEEENLALRYLLGDLSEDEKQQVEDHFFKDDNYYESLLVAEDELIYNYLRGGLSQPERELFETQLATSARRREKVEVVKVLMAEAAAATLAKVEVAEPTPAAQESPRWWQAVRQFFAGQVGALQFAMAAAMVLLAVAGVWLWLQTSNLKARVDIAEAKNQEAEQNARESSQREQSATEKANELQNHNQILNEQLSSEQKARQAAEKERAELEKRLQEEALKHPTSQTPFSGSIVSFALESGIRRDEGDEPQRLRIPANARQIQLQLDLGSDDGKGFYRAEVKTFGGALVWSKDGLSVSSASWGKAVNLLLPTAIFKNGEYELTLKRLRGPGRFEDAAYYYFKTEKP
jgi:hypothetical protein